MHSIFRPLAAVAVVLVALVGLRAGPHASGADDEQTSLRQERPLNVLFLAVDDLRPALGAYGDAHAVTPTLDRLAEQGVAFERAYANVPVCGASRASLLTGLRPTVTRFVTYYARADQDAPNRM